MGDAPHPPNQRKRCLGVTKITASGRHRLKGYPGGQHLSTGTERSDGPGMRRRPESGACPEGYTSVTPERSAATARG